MIQPAFEILNQRGTPMFFSDVFANIPTAGIVGRIFIRTDSPYGIYRDTGSTWDQIAGSGGGGGITGSGVAGQVTFWDGTSSVSGSNNLWFDNASGKFLVGTNNTTGAAKLQVTSATGDDQLRVWGATSPSIRIDNAVSGASQRFVMGLATATNNFIQGSAAGNICISTASANPLLFGMWQTTNASEVMRISTANNLLIGLTTDNGKKLQVVSDADISGLTIGKGTNAISTNTAIGVQSLNAANTGIGNNTGIGYQSLNANTSGTFNTAIGCQSLLKNTTGGFNTALGAEALYNNTTSSNNVAVGTDALFNLTTGGGNVAIGRDALFTNNSLFNVAIGLYALRVSTGRDNVAIGYNAMLAATSPQYSTIIGSNAGAAITTGTRNTGIGASSLQLVTTGQYNIALGQSSGYNLTTGSNNIMIGSELGGVTTGSNNTIIGSNILPAQLSSSLSNNIILSDGAGNMRIAVNNSGDVVIGGTTTYPTFAGYKLDVQGTLRSTSNVLFGSSNNGSINATVEINNGTTFASTFVIANQNTGLGPDLNLVNNNSKNFRILNCGTSAPYPVSNQVTLSSQNGGFYFCSGGVNSTDVALAIFQTSKNVGINSGITDIASAQLFINSTTKGFLPPRMTTAQINAISSPAEGLVAYNTTLSHLCCYQAGAWVKFSHTPM